MSIGLRAVSRVASAVLLATGAAMTVVAPAAAQSHGGGGFHGGGGGGFRGSGGGSFRGGGGGFHGGGFSGYRGSGYGGYHGGGYGGYRGYGYRGYGGYYGGFGFGGFGCCYGGYYGGFGLGDALLGAAVIGGTAAVIASDQPTYVETYPPPVYAPYPPSYAPPPVGGYAPPPPVAPQQQAYRSTDPVEQCTRAALDETASRGDSGRVTKIDHVDGHPNGARVTGTIEVRRSSHNGELENARFTCTADYGQVTFFKFG